MASAKCTCEHDKKDHVRVSATAMGACKICLCNAYQGDRARQQKQMREPFLLPRPETSNDRSGAGNHMDCMDCKNLLSVFELAMARYVDARSSSFYRVSTDHAAKRQVDMERAKSDLEEHSLVCPFAPSDLMISKKEPTAA